MIKNDNKNYDPVNYTGFFLLCEAGVDYYRDQIRQIITRKYNEK